MQTAAALIYWVIIALWLAVLITVGTAYFRNPRTFGAIRLLLIVVCVDTFRNIIENLYFGVYFGSQYGILPAYLAEHLNSPYLLILPKLANVLAACVVLGLLLFRWLPLALEERSKAEEDVREKTVALTQETEERRRIFETSLDLIAVLDRRGTLVQLSQSAEAMLGYRLDEMQGGSIDAFLPADDLRRLHGELNEMSAGYPMRDVVMRLVQKSGAITTLTWMGNWSEPVQRYFLVGRDMTERQAAEEALRKSEQMSRGIVETALDAFVQFDAQGLIVDWSSQAERLFGWSQSEAVGSPFDAVVQLGAQTTLFKAYIKSLVEKPGGTRIQFDARRRNGEALKIELSMSAFKRQQGDYLFNAFMRDLTEKIAAETQLRQAQKMEAVGQLTGGVAHDFNNLLTVITGTIEILSEGVADRPDLSAITKMIEEAAYRGAGLTRQLLAFARRQPLQPAILNLNTLLLQTEKLLRATLGEQIGIETVLTKEPWLTFVDANQLASAILNLSINARDAMPAGGKLVLETHNVTLDEGYARQHAEVEPGDYVQLAVNDNGTGIPQAIVDHIFEPFFTTKEVGKGSGLGLSMVYGFVKQSGGHIRVYSEERRGTSFKLYFPRSTDAPESQDLDAAKKLASGTELILVVEDDSMVRNYVAGQVRGLGYETLVAADAQEALKILKDNPRIDLLFTDVIMPGSMNGPELAQQAQNLRPGIKVLYTSGYAENAIIHNGRLDSGIMLLSKPYRRAELAQMLRTALDTAPAES